MQWNTDLNKWIVTLLCERNLKHNVISLFKCSEEEEVRSKSNKNFSSIQFQSILIQVKQE